MGMRAPAIVIFPNAPVGCGMDGAPSRKTVSAFHVVEPRCGGGGAWERCVVGESDNHAHCKRLGVDRPADHRTGLVRWIGTGAGSLRPVRSTGQVLQTALAERAVFSGLEPFRFALALFEFTLHAPGAPPALVGARFFRGVSGAHLVCRRLCNSVYGDVGHGRSPRCALRFDCLPLVPTW